MSNAHTKVCWISSNGLGGNSRTDGGHCNISDAFLKKRGDKHHLLMRQVSHLLFDVEFIYSKACVKRPLSKRPKIGFQDQLSLNTGQKYCRMLQWEHSAILSTYIKLPFVIKILVIPPANFVLPPANFVCGGYTVFTLSVCASVRNILFP